MVVAIIVVVYLYKKNQETPVPPPTIDEQKVRDEVMTKELLKFNKSSTPLKSDKEIKQDLQSFKTPTGADAISDEEMLRSLNDPSIKVNP